MPHSLETAVESVTTGEPALDKRTEAEAEAEADGKLLLLLLLILLGP